jgi:hypothetical protein
MKLREDVSKRKNKDRIKHEYDCSSEKSVKGTRVLGEGLNYMYIL